MTARVGAGWLTKAPSSRQIGRMILAGPQFVQLAPLSPSDSQPASPGARKLIGGQAGAGLCLTSRTGGGGRGGGRGGRSGQLGPRFNLHTTQLMRPMKIESSADRQPPTRAAESYYRRSSGLILVGWRVYSAVLCTNREPSLLPHELASQTGAP